MAEPTTPETDFDNPRLGETDQRALPADTEVFIVNQHGERGTVPRAKLELWEQAGWRLEGGEETQGAILEQEYGDSPWQAAGEGFARSLTLGASDVALGALDEEGVRERRGRNAGAAVAGEVAGALVPIGGGGLATGAGRLATRGIGTAKVGGRLAKAAAQGAVEGAVFGAGQGVSAAALSEEPLNAEQVVGLIGDGIIEGGLIGGAVGGGVGALAEGAKGAKQWYSAFKGANGQAAAPAGDSLRTLIPPSKARAALKGEERALSKAQSAERAAISGERNAAADALRAERQSLAAADEVARGKRFEVRDQFEVELGIMDHASEQALSRAKLLKDMGGWPDDIIATTKGGAKRRVNPMRSLVDDVNTARAEVQTYFPHAGETVTREGKALRDFTLKASADDVARTMADKGDDAIAAVSRYEKAMLNLHNAVNAPGQKALSAADLWLEKTAPQTLLQQTGGDLAMAEKIGQIDGTLSALDSAPLTSAKLKEVDDALGKVRAALKEGGSDSASATREALKKLEATTPGMVSKIPDEDVAAALRENGLPDTPGMRDTARLHIAEVRMKAANPKSKWAGLGDKLGGNLGGRTQGYLLGAAMSGLGPAGLVGAVVGDVVLGLIGKRSSAMTKALDKILGAGGKAAKALKEPVRRAAVPALRQTTASSAKTSSKTYDQKVAAVREFTADPAGAAAKAAPLLAAVSAADPAFASQVQSVEWRKMEYLAATAPKSPFPPNIMGGYEWEAEPGQKAAWLRRYEAANNPLSVIENAASGMVTPEEAQTLQVVYPELYGSVKEYVAENLASVGGKLPYDGRLAMSVLFQEPIEPSLRSLNTFQMNYMQDEQPEPAGGNLGALRTPEQTAAQRITTR